jgi:hypothetical protein
MFILAVPIFFFPSTIPRDSAISILNDVVIVDGVLTGFVSVITATNFAEMNRWQEQSLKKAYREFVRRDVAHPKIIGLFDFLTIMFFLIGLFTAIGQIAYVGTSASGQTIGGSVAISLSGVYLLAMQFLLRLFATKHPIGQPLP